MIGEDLFVFAFIADIHFGAVRAEELYQQLDKKFLKVINKKRIDMVVLGGDLFHSIITMNYSTSHYVLLFMERLLELCVKNHIKYVRIIQGTMSHDNNQLNNFHIFEDRTDVDFKIIMTAREEQLSEGLRILYLPEEYMTNPEEFYEPLLSEAKKYDFIFGHGMFRETAFIGKEQTSEVTMSKAPIFNSKQVLGACKGPVYFGHIHIRTDVRKHIHYPGSFSRFRFGEETEKGFYLCVYDKVSHKYVDEFVVNDLAETYTTVLVTLEKPIAPEELVAMVKVALEENDFVRLMVVMSKEGDYSFMVAYLNETFQKHPRVKLVFKDTYEFKREIEREQVIDEVLEKYRFVFEEGIEDVDMIRQFIKAKHNKDVPIEAIKTLLNLKERSD